MRNDLHYTVYVGVFVHLSTLLFVVNQALRENIYLANDDMVT